MKDSGFGSFLAGLVIGGLVGAAIGLLVAPRAGDEMREQVGEFVGEKRAAFDEARERGRRLSLEEATVHALSNDST